MANSVIFIRMDGGQIQYATSNVENLNVVILDDDDDNNFTDEFSDTYHHLLAASVSLPLVY